MQLAAAVAGAVGAVAVLQVAARQCGTLSGSGAAEPSLNGVEVQPELLWKEGELKLLRVLPRVQGVLHTPDFFFQRKSHITGIRKVSEKRCQSMSGLLKG